MNRSFSFARWARLVSRSLCVAGGLAVVVPAPLVFAANGSLGEVGLPHGPLSQVLTFRAANGGTAYHSISLQSAIKAQRGPLQHVVLVDTSASQQGDYRKESLSFVNEFISNLPAADSVMLIAIDQSAKLLTTEFVSASSTEMATALGQLKRIVPLGATNLLAGLKSAEEHLAAANGSILYVGDGFSTAEFLPAADVAELGAGMRARQVPVHSYAVGPRVNLPLLGTLAHQTGGVVLLSASVGDAEEPAGVMARRMVAATSLAVEYGDKVTVSNRSLKLLPVVALPLRSDRSTIYLAEGELPTGSSLSFTTASGVHEFAIREAAATSGMACLPALVKQAVETSGVANALAGAELLSVAANEYEDRVALLLVQGEQLEATGQKPELQAVAGALAELAPDNPSAERWLGRKSAVKAVFASRQEEAMEGEAADEEAAPGEMAPEAANDDGDLSPRVAADPARSLIEEREQLIRVVTEKLRQQVSNVIQFSRASSEAQAGIDELKRTLNAVRSASDIDVRDRAKLEKLIESELFTLANRVEKEDQDRIRRLERSSQVEAKRRLVERAILDEDKLDNLIDRVRALMQQGRHGDDQAYAEAEEVAKAAVDLEPGEPTAEAARFVSEAALQLRRTQRLRAKRADAFLETLHQVELSHVAFPGEPPVVFPAPEIWKALTEKRAKYKSVDLRNESPSEQRISQELQKPTDVDFADTPLKDAIKFIEEYHGISILIDEKKLSEEGIPADSTNVSLRLSGVPLKSALRLLLGPLELTYLIKDDVMRITTKTEAEDAGNATIRVYPVGDLAAPIPILGGGMGGMGGGGMGGGGMGGGGMGGMGGGGMGGGGQQGGGGGGFFSVPPEAVQPEAVVTPALKKKQ